LTFSALAAQTQRTASDSTFYRGIRIEADILSPLAYALRLSGGYYYQGAIAVNLKETYFPILEIGYGGLDNKMSVSGLTYNTHAFYYRVGIDYNVLTSKKPLNAMNNIFTVGGRIGFTNMLYNISDVQIADYYWGGNTTVDFTDRHKFMLWWEVPVGVRVEIFNNIFMGWEIRLKGAFGTPKQGEIYPYYVPGLGLFNGNKWEFNYSLGWQF
jgi:hypothetical protein